jgi:hypothetical protein
VPVADILARLSCRDGDDLGRLDALAKFAQVFTKTYLLEGPKGELNEGPKLPIQASQHRAQFFSPFPCLHIQLFWIGIMPIGGNGSARPVG